MSTMNISLPEELRAWVEEQVRQGGYASNSEYFRELVRAERKRRAHERLEQLLLEGLESGEPLEITPEFWARKREELRARLEQRRTGG